ncbi:transmembrane secretion effector [Tumebacillus permanentifrigoris]|uniref:Transmembrane secretion effector n=1 Tax=Tumebacillus permanentifrigoris TaxID=378543 RepID=A0A316DA89_9BACL|nr:transmembrane secretion effector [Tumebacillus permanentifrigoris]
MNVFKNTNYLKIYSAMTISKLGDWFFTIALPLLVYDLTKSASKMALVFVVGVLPQVLFSLIGGALADQLNKKKIMIFGDLLSAVLVSVIPIMYMVNGLQVWMVYIIAFLLASVSAFYHPSFEATIPQVLKREDYVKGNSYLKLMDTVITFVGPSLTGLLIAMLGVINVLVFDALSFLLSAVILSLVKVDYVRLKKQFPKLLAPIREGLHYVKNNKVILSGALIMLGINLGYGAVDSLLLFFLKDHVELDSTGIGLFLSLQALGPFLAVYLASRFKKFPRGNIIVTCGIMIGIAEIGLIFSEKLFLVLLLCQVVAKGAATLLAINWFTLRQEIVPSDLLGRVVSSTRMLAYISLPISGMIAGNAVGFVSIYNIFVISGVIVLVSSFIGLRTPLFSKKTDRLAKEQDPLPKHI